MRVRFYRGPLDGKVKEIPNHVNIWEIKTYNGSLFPIMDFMPPNQTMIAPSIQVDSHLYHKTHHTHPDGSTFFEWNKPKGTRTGVKKRRKPKRSKTTWDIRTNPGTWNYTGNTITGTVKP